MLYTLQAYNGRKIKAAPKVEQNLVHLLRILAGRERDHKKVNIRTFHSGPVKKAGLALTVQDIKQAFDALEMVGACKWSEGSMDRIEVANFKESARMVARKLLGINKVLATEHLVLGSGPMDKDLEAAREILKADMPAEAKVRVLSTLLLKD